MSKKPKRKSKLLITHPWMGNGGSEATAVRVVEALQDRYSVSFCSANLPDWDECNAIYKAKVTTEKVEMIKAPKFPGLTSPKQLVFLQHSLFERYVHSIADDFDICVSAYNPVNFGKPSIQLIADFSFSEELRRLLYAHQKANYRHRPGLLRKLYFGAGKVLRPKSLPLGQRSDLIVSNSKWSDQVITSEFNVERRNILYPPVPGKRVVSEEGRNPFGFVCLGRISPEKEIEKIIGILEEVRMRFPKIHLTMVGGFDDTDYSRMIQDMIAERKDWISTPGFLDAAGKEKVFRENALAIHGCEIEAFGIAVAEMAMGGCVPFVPSACATTEIVPFSELQYRSKQDAVEKIANLLSDREKVEEYRERLVERVLTFSPKEFSSKLQEIVADFSVSST